MELIFRELGQLKCDSMVRGRIHTSIEDNVFRTFKIKFPFNERINFKGLLVDIEWSTSKVEVSELHDVVIKFFNNDGKDYISIAKDDRPIMYLEYHSIEMVAMGNDILKIDLR